MVMVNYRRTTNHRKIMGKSWENHGKIMIYPLVMLMTNIAIENHCFDQKFHYFYGHFPLCEFTKG